MRNRKWAELALVLWALFAIGCGNGPVVIDDPKNTPVDEQKVLEKTDKPVAIDDPNKPENLGFPIDRQYDASHPVGTVFTAIRIPYPGNWWPQWTDGINNRWQMQAGKKLTEKPEAVRKNFMSPAEKYDFVFNSWVPDEEFWGLRPMSKPGLHTLPATHANFLAYDKTYYDKLGPAATWEHKNSGHYKAINEKDDDGDGRVDEEDWTGRWDGLENWFGHCNGWSSAALHENEPRVPVTVNGVKFEVSDVKALLAETYFGDASTFTGLRCETAKDHMKTNAAGRPMSWADFAGGHVFSEVGKSVEKSKTEKFSFKVSGAKKVTVRMTGTNDADLYVKVGKEPTSSDYDCRPWENGSQETCEVTIPEGSGEVTVYVNVEGYSADPSIFNLEAFKEGALVEILSYEGPFWHVQGQSVKYEKVKFERDGQSFTGRLVMPYSTFQKNLPSKEATMEYDGRSETVNYQIIRGCNDTNPATMHLLATQILGKHKQGFVLDTSFDYQVWNYPVYKYRINEQTVVSKEDANGLLNVDRDKPYPYNDLAKKFVKVSMDIWYVSDAVSPRTTPTLSTVDQFTTQQTLTYVLELDETDKILGGEWTGASVQHHPDFAWLPFGHSDNGALHKGTFVPYDDDKTDGDNTGVAYSFVKRLAMEASRQDDESFKVFDGGSKTLSSNSTKEATLSLTEDGAIKQIAVKLDLTGVNLKYLTLTLVAPDGSEVVLMDKNGSGNNIKGLAVGRPWADESGVLHLGVDQLLGKNMKGTWKLIAKNGSTSSGNLNAWGLYFTYVPGESVQCESNSCSGHGTCSVTNNALSCACNAGYAGDNCGSCAVGYHDAAGACVPDATDPGTGPGSWEESGSVKKSESKSYTVTVPADAKNIVVTMTGPGNDADLYVRWGSAPTTSNYDCRPYLGGSNEDCKFAVKKDGKLYITVRGYDDADNAYALKVTWQTGEVQSSTESGTVAKDAEKHYSFNGNGTIKTFTFTLKSESGDADLYVKVGGTATKSSYDCRPYLGGTKDEVCSVTTDGAVDVMVRGWATSSKYTLEISQ